ncbi:Ca2-binding protein [Fragilaria crotonensis]|nr:Ca2-binding protein [Fragilaria crotonensis]
MNDRLAYTSPQGKRRTILVQYLLIGISGYILGTLSGKGHPSVENIATSRRLEDTSNDVDTKETGDHGSSSEISDATVTCIVLLLIVLTIVFEFSKEHLEEHATRNLRPLVDKLFGEMTVLGFLSVVTFCITQAGWFTVLSEKLFGEDNELLEIFEFVHFTIFFIMISFVLQVLVLVAAAMETEQEWLDMDQAARDTENTNQRTHGDKLSQNSEPRIRPFGDFVGLLPCFRNGTAQRKEDFLLFQALRNEFLLERSPHYPFHPAPEEIRVVDDFNFGRYLGINQGSLLAHVVEVSIITWTFFGFLTVIYFFFVIAVNGNVTTLAWSWVAVGWMVYAFHVFFERHLIQVRRMFLRKELYLSTKVDNTKENDGSLLTPLETTYLNSIVSSNNIADNQTLPQWSDIDIDDYHQNRSWLARVLAGGGGQSAARNLLA